MVEELKRVKGKRWRWSNSNWVFGDVDRDIDK